MRVTEPDDDSAFDSVEVGGDLVDVTMVQSNEDLEPFGSGDARWRSLFAGGRRDVVKETGMVAGIADDGFDRLASMFLADWLGETADIDELREDDIDHRMDIWAQGFGDFL